MSLTDQQRINLIRCYHQSGDSLARGFRQYRRENGLFHGPCSREALRKLVLKFEVQGSVLTQKRSGRPSVSDIDVAEILEKSKELSKENAYGLNSAHEVARQLDKPYSTVRKVLRKT